MEASNPDRDGGLVLLIDDDVESRRHSRRLFRPDMPVICLSGAKAGISAAGGCLAKPLQSSELHAALDASLRGDSVGWDPRFAEALNGPAAARARARFAVAGDLVEAAMELARVDRGA